MGEQQAALCKLAAGRAVGTAHTLPTRPPPVSLCPLAPQSGVLAPGGPFALLDLFPLTRQCGEECSPDGVHSVPQVYDAALQILLNQAWPAQRSWQDLLQGVRQGAQRRRRRLSAA